MIALPIDPYLTQIVERLVKKPNLLLKAQPGTGKTTRVPAALLTSSFCGPGREIWVLEPRRLAAKLAARRVAEERGENIGETVGYQFRHEKVGGPKTRLRFFTEGMILRHLISQPELPQVAAIVLDEFHERHLQGDLALAALRRLQRTRRPDLRLLVMSATLETQRLEEYLDHPDVLDIEAPHHKLTVRNYSPQNEMRLDEAVPRALKMALGDPLYRGGDFLVFLPGTADIRRCEQSLLPMARELGLLVVPLHGDLSKEEQDVAVSPNSKTKVILSTNIAESSLTIEGVEVVIDSGLHRQASYSPWSGMPSLQTKPISKASATQRAGRACRTGPGLCFRLYSQADFDQRPAQDTPEILRADMAQTLLELKTLGQVDENGFEWFERPAEGSLQSGRELLFCLGAIQNQASGAGLTELGEKMARLPLHPRLARLVLEAQTRQCLGWGIHLASLLSEGLLTGSDAFASMQKQTPPERVTKQIASYFPSAPRKEFNQSELAQSALAAFPDRVAKLRAGSREDLVLCGGGSIKATDAQSLGNSEYFLVLGARETKAHGQARVQTRGEALIAIEPEWLMGLTPSLLTDEASALSWDDKRNRVTAQSRLLYGQLVVEQTQTPISDYEAAAEVLLQAVLGIRKKEAEGYSAHDWIEHLLPVCGREVLEGVFARHALAQQFLGSETANSIFERLRTTLLGKTRLDELQQLDWESALLPIEKFGRSLPPHIELGGGRKVKVHYSLGRPPWIESRLQDFFGMKESPALLGGKVPLTVHLLAPNYRAVQVTTDLAGFWKNTYPAVKRELCRNYPRHSWPEDPANASPPAPKVPRSKGR